MAGPRRNQGGHFALPSANDNTVFPADCQETWTFAPLISEKGIALKIHVCFFQLSSVAPSCPTLCNPMDCSIPGFPVYHQLTELAQIHVHQVGDAIQPSCPLSSPSPLAFNHSQHQSFPMSQLFAPRGQNIGISASASVLPMNSQD